MRYVLDTDHITFLQRAEGGEFATLKRRIDEMASEATLSVTVVSFQEQMLGANAEISQAKSPARLARGYFLLARTLTSYRDFDMLGYDLDDIAMFDDLRQQGVRVATMDLRIASIVLRHGYTLLTRNRSDFSLVPGLRIEDWTA